MVFVGGEGRENANGGEDGEVAATAPYCSATTTPSPHTTGAPSLSGMAHFTIYLRGPRPFDRYAGTIECMDPTDRHGGR